MITIEESIPKKSVNYLLGQDILWTQFNDVNFYVEDIEQENFYFEILSKLFPDIKFDRIFPLGGKKNVVDEAKSNIGDKKKVFIVDLDFDEILSKKENQANLFYLNRYSIENHLIEESAIISIIKEEKPKVKEETIKLNFSLNNFLNESKQLFHELICSYLTIQKYGLSIDNVKNDTARFCDFTHMPARLKTASCSSYYQQIQIAINGVNRRVKLSTQIRFFKRYFRTIKDCLTNIPGKYLLNFLKYRIEHLFSINQMSLESFTYRLARNCNLTEMHYLQTSISKFLAT